VTGTPYEHFVVERVLRPSGMRSTGYYLEGLDTSRVAHTYTPPVDRGDPATRLAHAVGEGPSWDLMGNGGMLTTVDDIYAYELALRRGRPISGAIQAKQFGEQFRRSATLAHGSDWWIEPAEDGGIQYNRAGDGPPTGVQAEYRRYPKDSTVFIFLGNTRHHGWSSRRYVMPRLRRTYIGTPIEPPIVTPLRPGEGGRFRGTYMLDSASYISVDTSRGRLVLSAVGQRAANVLIASRDSANVAQRAIADERAAAFFKALATNDSAATVTTFGSAARAGRLVDAWRGAEADLGRLKCFRVLGTDLLDRGTLLTTVRLGFADSAKTVRFSWAGNVATASSEDFGLLNYLGFAPVSPVDGAVWSPYWYLRGDTLLTYDLASGSELKATVEPSTPVAALTFLVPSGAVRATRGAPARESWDYCH
jgi:hypothetical protein